MKSDQTMRESQRVIDLASEYGKKGYSVVLPRSVSDLPAFLRGTNYLPDLIATSKSDNLVVEVKTSENVQSLDRLSSVSELVNAQEGWQFVLVLTNPREPQLPGKPLNASKVIELLSKSRAIRASTDPAHIEASFLFAWAALEASLRLLSQVDKRGRQPSTPLTLIRNATMAGHLERKDAQALDRLFRIRNSLLHAGDEGSPTMHDVELLHRVAEASIRESRKNEV